MLFPRLCQALGGLCLLSLTLGPGATAWADDGDLARARKLYTQGLTQEAAGDWGGALSSFEDVARVKMTPQVRFHVARCKENLGRWNEALGGYRLAEYEAEGDPEIAEEITKARTELEQKIPKLVIERGRGADAIKVELDGVVLGDTQIGADISVDPGTHVVVGIVAPGRRFKRQVALAEGATERVVLDVPSELAESAAGEPPASASPPVGEPSRPASEPSKPSNSAAPWILGGVGLVSLGVSAVFYKMRNDAKHDLDQQCIGTTCPDTLKDTQSKGQTYAALSGVTLGIGIVAVGAGALLLVSRSSSSTPPPAARFLPGFTAGRHWAEMSFAGAF